MLSKNRYYDPDTKKYEESLEIANQLKGFHEKLNSFKEQLEKYDNNFFENLHKIIDKDIKSIFSVRKISGVVVGRVKLLDKKIIEFVQFIFKNELLNGNF